LGADAAVQRAGGNTLPCQRELRFKYVLHWTGKDPRGRQFGFSIRGSTGRWNRHTRKLRLRLHPPRRRLGPNNSLRGRCASSTLRSWRRRFGLAGMPPNPTGHNQSHQCQQPEETAAPPLPRTRQIVFGVAPHLPI
jgi:hypothetical protein